MPSRVGGSRGRSRLPLSLNAICDYNMSHMEKIISLAQVRERAQAYRGLEIPGSESYARAAVAIIFRENREDQMPELLMIRRAEHPRDPWSGHIGFPGGRVDSQDESTLQAAVRETREELGIELAECAERVGRLSRVQARSLHKLLPLVITPHVFHLTGSCEFRFNKEVAEAFWIPLTFFLSPQNREEFETQEEEPRLLPCYHFAGRRVWGLSLMMLDELLFQVLGDQGDTRT